MTFVEVGNTMFNTANIRKIVKHWPRDKSLKRYVTLEYTDGEVERIEHEDAYNAFNGTTAASVIPALPGWNEVHCWFWEETPTLKTICREPIIGWQVNRVYGKIYLNAITLDEGPRDDEAGRSAILRPDGVVVVTLIQSWDSLTKWFETEVLPAWMDKDKKIEANV